MAYGLRPRFASAVPRTPPLEESTRSAERETRLVPAEDPSPYEDMTDAELRAELRRHLDDRSWTLNHMVELERRGFDCLDPDPELAEAVRAEYDRLGDRLREAFEPIAARWRETLHLSDVGKKLAEQIGSQVAPLTLSNIDRSALTVPTPTEAAWLSPPKASTVPMTAPIFDELIDQMAEQAAERAETAERSVALQVEQLEVLRDLRTAATKRDGWDIAGIVAAIIAAFAASVAAIATVEWPF